MKGKLQRWFKRRLQKLKGVPVLQSFEQQQEKFYKKYPHYKLGEASYGLPIVHPAEGATLQIGAYCSIAGGVQIFLGSHHRTDWISTYPFPAFFSEAHGITDYEISRGNVVIGSDVWLCSNCTILSGVTIGHGAVVAADAVVSRDVEPFAVVAGNPARVVRYRFEEKVRRELLNLAWWTWPQNEVLTVVHLLCSDRVNELLDYGRSRKTNGPDQAPTD